MDFHFTYSKALWLLVVSGYWKKNTTLQAYQKAINIGYFNGVKVSSVHKSAGKIRDMGGMAKKKGNNH